VSEFVEKITTRLARLHPKLIDLSLDRLRALLIRLDAPWRRRPACACTSSPRRI
jgi:hypothetical protein